MAETIWDNKNPIFKIIIVILTLNFSGFFLPNLLHKKGFPIIYGKAINGNGKIVFK